MIDNLLLFYSNSDYFHIMCGDFNSHTDTVAGEVQECDDYMDPQVLDNEES